MSRVVIAVACLMVVMLLMAAPEAAWAQPSALGAHSLSAAYVAVDFSYTGKVDAPARFDYAAPALGLSYVHGNMRAMAFVSGTSDGVRLVDFSGTTSRTFKPLRVQVGTTSIGFPVSLAAGYRRAMRADTEAYNATSVGLGFGVALESALTTRVLLDVRATPVFGLASSTLTDAFGFSYLLESDADLHVRNIFARLGLSFGYSVRYQVWNINASKIFFGPADDIFDYRGLHYVFRLGVNF